MSLPGRRTQLRRPLMPHYPSEILEAIVRFDSSPPVSYHAQERFPMRQKETIWQLARQIERLAKMEDAPTSIASHKARAPPIKRAKIPAAAPKPLLDSALARGSGCQQKVARNTKTKTTPDGKPPEAAGDPHCI